MITLYDGMFQRGTDYKKAFTTEVDKLTAQNFTDEFKIKLIHLVTEAYFEQTGETPDSFELSRLTSWLVEDKENDPDKVTNTEYPILSESQIKLRKRRESASPYIESSSSSAKPKMNGSRKPKSFKVFGEYEGGY